MYTTGDKLLNVMKEEEIGIAELSKISGVPERIILDIMAGVKEPELGVMCKIAEELGICVHELRADEEHLCGIRSEGYPCQADCCQRD